MNKTKNNLYELHSDGKIITFDVNSSTIYASSKEDLLKFSDVSNEKNSIKHKIFPDKMHNQSMVINCAENCNLKCTYCFANEGTYNTSKKKIMKNSDYDTLLNKLSNHPLPLKSISLFGGEPLLGFRYIKQFIENLKECYNEKGWNLPIISIVTNGTLMNDEIMEFFEMYNIFVTISLDGEKKINDLNRIFKNENESVYEKVVNILNKSKKYNFSIIASATLSNQVIINYERGDYENYLNHFESIGFDSVEHFIADENVPLSSVEVEKIKLYAKDKVEVTFKRLCENNMYVSYGVLGVLSCIVKKKYKSECGAGLNQIFYSADGEFFPCHTYYSDKIIQRKKISRTDITECKNCICLNTCNMYCPGSSLFNNGDESKVVSRRCEYQRALTEQIIINLFKYFYNGDTETQEKIVNNMKIISKRSVNLLNI